jgi:hypothetical protein
MPPDVKGKRRAAFCDGFIGKTGGKTFDGQASVRQNGPWPQGEAARLDPSEDT